jgi:SAM-dependent methyltransferase
MSELQTIQGFETALASLRGAVPDNEEYGRLCSIFLDDPIAHEMKTMDPFSTEYRTAAMQLYLSLGKRAGVRYSPEIHEMSGNSAMPADIWRQSSPWSFRNPSMVSEFLICWGHIMRMMDLPANSEASILEYGPGSGQLLLFLARMGLDVHAVDIDQPSLDLIAAQAETLNLDVKCQRALFGEGFEEKKFDRIIFFEAFHHAWDFETLLDRLEERLNPGGLLILCGEPVVNTPTPAVPFPWGPRMDGLSVFCMRHHGWMELGFSVDFLFEVFRRRGWLVSDHHIAGYGRASGYVARKAAGTTIKAGNPDAIGARHWSGWDAPEGTHRWTKGGVASVPMPRGVSVTVRIANMLNLTKKVSITSGDVVERITLPAGASGEITLRKPNGLTIDIECEGHCPKDVNQDATDDRMLGVAVKEIIFA